jgi:hypothetical protein
VKLVDLKRRQCEDAGCTVLLVTQYDEQDNDFEQGYLLAAPTKIAS